MDAGQDDAKTVTLMSTDAERAVNGLQMLHETWARILEIAIGIYLLTTRMGAVSVSPILVATGESPCHDWPYDTSIAHGI